MCVIEICVFINADSFILPHGAYIIKYLHGLTLYDYMNKGFIWLRLS